MRRRSSAMRTAVRDARRVATVAGFGPRFLHSTGQAYKGGPAGGVFLEITRKAEPDLAIPGHRASFGTVQLAQALGDLDVLAERGRPWLRIHIEGDVDAGLAAIGRLVDRGPGLRNERLAHAHRNDRPWPDGRQHREAPDAGRT